MNINQFQSVYDAAKAAEKKAVKVYFLDGTKYERLEGKPGKVTDILSRERDNFGHSDSRVAVTVGGKVFMPKADSSSVGEETGFSKVLAEHVVWRPNQAVAFISSLGSEKSVKGSNKVKVVSKSSGNTQPKKVGRVFKKIKKVA